MLNHSLILYQSSDSQKLKEEKSMRMKSDSIIEEDIEVINASGGDVN